MKAFSARGWCWRSSCGSSRSANHPSQWSGDGEWSPEASGKWAIAVIAAKQEKVLVFTQFREATEPLSAFLGSVFGRSGLVLLSDLQAVVFPTWRGPET